VPSWCRCWSFLLQSQQQPRAQSGTTASRDRHKSKLCVNTDFKLQPVSSNIHSTSSRPQLQVGCGADELIDLLMRCFLDEGDCIIDCPPTFTMYAFDSEVNAGTVITVPRLNGFKLDIPAITAAVLDSRPKLVFLTSPNNPDGSLITEAELLEVLALPVLVVLDEAYIEFSGEGTRMPWVSSVPNLIVLRTFSKSAGLAGLRVGCASDLHCC
jgi:histidinol-phosphate aminotransferase